MTTTNNSTSPLNGGDLSLQALMGSLEQSKKTEKDQSALLLSLSRALQETVEKVGGSATGAVAPSATAKAQTPSNGTMQKDLSELMGHLAELENVIAQWGHDKTQMTADIGRSLLAEMQSQVRAAQQQLENVTKSEEAEGKAETVNKVIGVVIGAVIAAVAVACGQPELAVLVIVMTVMSATGETDKITQAISKALQADGVPAGKANILAAAIVIVATIVLTAGATVGYSAVMGGEMAASAAVTSAARAAADSAEEGLEMTDIAAGTASSTAEATTTEAETVTEQSAKGFLTRARESTFGRLPKAVNVGIVAGSMAVSATNFSQYLAQFMLKKKDGNDTGVVLLTTIIDLMAALAGAGAGTSVSSAFKAGESEGIMSRIAGRFSGMTTRGLQALQTGLLVAGAAQAGAEFTQAGIQGKLAKQTEVLGEDQAFVALLQSLINRNNAQMTADTKTLSGQLRTHSEQLAEFGADIVKEGRAVAQVLQA